MSAPVNTLPTYFVHTFVIFYDYRFSLFPPPQRERFIEKHPLLLSLETLIQAHLTWPHILRAFPLATAKLKARGIYWHMIHATRVLRNLTCVLPIRIRGVTCRLTVVFSIKFTRKNANGETLRVALFQNNIEYEKSLTDQVPRMYKLFFRSTWKSLK